MPPLWDTGAGFLAPGFSLVDLRLLQHLGSKRADGGDLSLSPPFCCSNKSINIPEPKVK